MDMTLLAPPRQQSSGLSAQAWQRETARLRAMIPLLKGQDLVEAYGVLAALEASV